MAVNWARPHHGHASEYQVHGFPFITGSVDGEVATSVSTVVSFPYVTQFVQITCFDGADGLLVGFSENGVAQAETSNAFYVPPNTAYPVLEVKCREIFFRAASNTSGFTIVAGLTNVIDFPALSGSNGFEGIG